MYVKVNVRSIAIPAMPEIHLSEQFRQALDLLVYFLKPASMAAFVLAFWRLGSDLGWTSEFLFADGMASHWQLWIVIGAAMLALEKNAAKA